MLRVWPAPSEVVQGVSVYSAPSEVVRELRDCCRQVGMGGEDVQEWWRMVPAEESMAREEVGAPRWAETQAVVGESRCL